jgi:hypothetical protein
MGTRRWIVGNMTRYAHGPIMLALDRRIFDIPLEERLQSRTSDLIAWTKTMLPTIRLSIIARHRTKLVPATKTSVLISLIRQHHSEHERNARHRDRNGHYHYHHHHRPYRTSYNRHSTAISTDKKPARYDFNQHSQIQTPRHP